jgi:Na+/glutamate symporter
MSHLVSELVLGALLVCSHSILLLLGQSDCRHVLVVDVVLLLQTLLLPEGVSGGISVEGVVLQLLVDGGVSDATSEAVSTQILHASTAALGNKAGLRSILSGSRDQQL